MSSFEIEQTQNSILAFDILPMSSTERQGGVKVAAFLSLSKGEEKEWHELSRKKLINIIRQYKPRFIGTDNPSEILKEGEGLSKFCRLLPSNCSLVHVNLSENGTTVPLKKILMEYNITKTNEKLSPQNTAKALVRLISLGVGMVLEPFENETLVEIGRPRSSGRGGWSQARFERQGEEIIAMASNNLREQLKKNNMSFDENTISTKYGAKQSRFHIFESRENVKNILNKTSYFPAKLKIWSPQKHVISHRPIKKDYVPLQSSKNRIHRLIVGIDPGMTIGVAIVNLDGHVLKTYSKANLSKGELVSQISEYGIPIMICTDVPNIPTFVSKFAATFNAEISYPRIELSQIDKRQLAKKIYENGKLDAHERDALAAVSYAFEKLEHKFEKLVSEHFNSKQMELAKSLIIQGLSVNDSIIAAKTLEKQISRVKEEEKFEIIKEEEEKIPKEVANRLYNLLNEMSVYEETMINLRAHAGRLKSALNLERKKNLSLKNKLKNTSNEITKELLSTELIEDKSREIRWLKQEITDLKEQNSSFLSRITSLEKLLWLSLEEGGYPVKILPSFSHDAIYDLRKISGIDDSDVILILDPTGGGPQTAYSLSEVKLKMIFLIGKDLPDEINEIFLNKNIPVMRAEDYDVRRIGTLAMINTSNLERALRDYDQIYMKKIAIKKQQAIEKTILNYKYERAKELDQLKKTYDDYELDDEEEIY